MKMDWKYCENNTRIKIDVPLRSRKKVTGTRFGAVLGLNEWATPFQMWCEITKLAQPPFEDTKYTLAGKAIEPKLIDKVREDIFDLDKDKVKDPIEYFGNIYEDVKYDFFKNEDAIFGGMWDAVHLDTDNKIDTIIECKTSSRPQDWMEGVPTHYLVQGLLYGYLTHAKKVLFPVSFLREEDYAHPEEFVCTNENTKIYEVPIDTIIMFKGTPCSIFDLVDIARDWYETYVGQGQSPKFDEEKDEAYLSIIRKAKPSEDLSLDAMTEKALQIQARIEELTKEAGLDDLEKELKALKDSIKEQLMSKMSINDKSILYNRFNLSKSIRNKIDEEKLKEDGIYDKYVIPTESYTLTIKKEK